MTSEQIIQLALAGVGLLFGGGGIAALVGVFVTRKLGIKTGENEANRDLNSTWDSIVENLQSQINSQSEAFRAELARLGVEMSALKSHQTDLENNLNAKERLLLRAIAHMYKLEILIPSDLVPKRPEGLE